MVFASRRWLGVRLDCLSALLTGAVALAAVLCLTTLVNPLVYGMRKGNNSCSYVAHV